MLIKWIMVMLVGTAGVLRPVITLGNPQTGQLNQRQSVATRIEAQLRNGGRDSLFKPTEATLRGKFAGISDGQLVIQKAIPELIRQSMSRHEHKPLSQIARSRDIFVSARFHSQTEREIEMLIGKNVVVRVEVDAKGFMLLKHIALDDGSKR